MDTIAAITATTEMTVQEKRDFLQSHFRYDNMNSWNRVTTFAANVKLCQSNYTQKIPDNAWDFLDCVEAYDNVNAIIEDFTKETGGHLTISFNGRSNGYLVLKRSQYKECEHKSICMSCYQRNFQAVPEGQTGVCGKCGKPTRVNHKFEKELSVYIGRGIGENLGYLEDDEIEGLYEDVLKFDEAVENCKAAFIDYCENHRMEEQTVMVEKKIKVPVEVE